MTFRNFAIAFGFVLLAALVLDQMPKRQSDKHANASDVYASVDLFVDPVEEAARMALDRKITLQLKNVPLREATRRLEDLLGIEIILDEAELKGSKTTPETPVSIDVQKITARETLRLILEPEELTTVVTGGSLWITPDRTDCESWKFRMYDIADLVMHKSADVTTATNVDDFVELIKFAVAPDTWEEVGGPGVVKVFQSEGTVVLVIRQPPSIHEDIDMFLAKLRQMRHTR